MSFPRHSSSADVVFPPNLHTIPETVNQDQAAGLSGAVAGWSRPGIAAGSGRDFNSSQFIEKFESWIGVADRVSVQQSRAIRHQPSPSLGADHVPSFDTPQCRQPQWYLAPTRSECWASWFGALIFQILQATAIRSICSNSATCQARSLSSRYMSIAWQEPGGCEEHRNARRRLGFSSSLL